MLRTGLVLLGAICLLSWGCGSGDRFAGTWRQEGGGSGVVIAKVGDAYRLALPPDPQWRPATRNGGTLTCLYPDGWLTLTYRDGHLVMREDQMNGTLTYTRVGDTTTIPQPSVSAH